MLKNFKNKIKKNFEISSLIILIFITTISTTYFNYKKNNEKTYVSFIDNVYFNKSLKHIISGLEPKYIKIKHKNGNFYIIAHLSRGPDPVQPSGGSHRPAVQPLTPYQKSLYTGNKNGGGGPMRHDQLTQTFDGEGMTDLIIINNTQPIVVPGPTRYIRR